MTNLALAADIASQAHEGQLDKLGKPYIEHCRRVADAVETLDEKIIAYLHDVMEKSPGWNRQRLEDAGFSTAVVSAVDALTRREGEKDGDFVRRAASNPLVRVVKRADLLDHRCQKFSSVANRILPPTRPALTRSPS
jgi:(p)ppGpp synthase/HD superfamily hydrolase